MKQAQKKLVAFDYAALRRNEKEVAGLRRPSRKFSGTNAV
jgi:hypothetical protein